MDSNNMDGWVDGWMDGAMCNHPCKWITTTQLYIIQLRVDEKI